MKHLKEIVVVVGTIVFYIVGAVVGYCISNSNNDNKGIAMLGCAIIGLALFAGIGTVVEKIRKWWIGRKGE